MKFELNGREVVDIEIDFHGADSFIIAAVYLDTLEELTDNELDKLTNDYPDYVCNEVMEHYGYMPD